MLYFKALFDGLDAMPPADAGRARRARRRGAPSAAGRRCTPSWRASTRSPPRACRPATRSASSARWRCSALSGRPLSSFHRERAARPPPRRRCSRSNRPTAPGCTSASRSASTRCSPPAWSTKCARCARAATCTPSLPSMRCVGYRQAWEALDAGDLGAAARARHRRHAPARQAPAHLAARHAGARGDRLRRAGAIGQVVARARRHAERLMER